MSPQPVVVSWSGGKDSALALAALRADTSYRPVALLTTVTRGYERISIHGVRRTLLHAQAASVGLPLHEMLLEPQSSNEAYEQALASSLEVLRATYPGVRHLAFGDLFLQDVRRYREERLPTMGFEPVFPLWGAPTAGLARRFVAEGYRARIVCVDTTLLPAAFAGRSFDAALLDDLPPNVDPCGERGEFHTFVSAGPLFGPQIEYAIGEVVLREGRFAYCDLIGAADQHGKTE